MGDFKGLIFTKKYAANHPVVFRLRFTKFSEQFRIDLRSLLFKPFDFYPSLSKRLFVSFLVGGLRVIFAVLFVREAVGRVRVFFTRFRRQFRSDPSNGLVFEAIETITYTTSRA